LQTKIAALQKHLDDPGLYAKDRKAFDDTMAALAAAQTALADGEEQWLALEIMREEIESG
jgi:ATP-binding cassette subfamily F protein uup